MINSKPEERSVLQIKDVVKSFPVSDEEGEAKKAGSLSGSQGRRMTTVDAIIVFLAFAFVLSTLLMLMDEGGADEDWTAGDLEEQDEKH